jgi:hypothetical protein
MSTFNLSMSSQANFTKQFNGVFEPKSLSDSGEKTSKNRPLLYMRNLITGFHVNHCIFSLLEFFLLITLLNFSVRV